MALPSTLSDYTWPNRSCYVGPFQWKGVYYIVGLWDSGSNFYVAVWRNTDPTVNWGTKYSASSNALSATLLNRCLWVCHRGQYLHTVFHDATGDTVEYERYDMEGNTWANVNAIPASSSYDFAQSCAVAVRNDGDIILLYNGDTESEMGSPYDRVYYARYEASWTVDVKVDNSDAGAPWDETDYYGSVIVKGSSDRMHCFFAAVGTGLFQRTLRSDNSLEAWPSVSDSASTRGRQAHGFSYFDGTDQLVRLPYMVTGDVVRLGEMVSSDSPGTFTPNTIGENDVDSTGRGQSILCGVAAGSDEYVVWSGGGAAGVDQDGYYDKNDASDVEWFPDATINYLSCNVYYRGTEERLAIVYDHAGATYYDEVDIGTPSFSTLSSVAVAEQNYYAGPFKT